ncbi:YsnF/AvaK domain-containing protein, partial [Saccharothrix hoggarensis]
PATDQAATGQAATGQAATGQADTGRRGKHEARSGTGDYVTRYEEDLDVGTRDVEAGKVRLVKHVVTEQRDVTVPVSHEEVRVVREPADGEPTGRAFTEEETEVTLHRQEPVVEKTTRPVEKVRMEKETVTEQQHVRGEVRKEQVDVERDDRTRRRDT